MAASTYSKIATTTLVSTTNSVTFSSISGSYTDLILVVNAQGSEGTALYLQYNSDTGSNYSFRNMTGFDGGTESGSATNSTEGRIGSLTGTNPHFAIAHIMNYSNTNTFKTCLSKGIRHGTAVFGFIHLWRSTSAITSLTCNISFGNFQVGGTFTLYGILKA